MLRRLRVSLPDGQSFVLRPGEVGHFGRTDPTRPSERQAELGPKLLISERTSVSRISGIVRATNFIWVVENRSRFQPLRLIDIDGNGDILLPSRSETRETWRRTSALAWQEAKLEIRFEASDSITLLVEADFDQGALDRMTTTVRTEDGTPGTPATKYHNALVVLCENRLRDPLNLALPSDEQIAQRLRATKIEPDATADRVNRSLVRARVHLGLEQGVVDFDKASIRHLCVDTALATGAVRRSDLDALNLLP